MVMGNMDVKYIITESRKMGKEKAVRYLQYHSDLQREKKERLVRRIETINDILYTIEQEIQRRKYQKEIVSQVPSGVMGLREKKEEEVKERV